MTRQAGEVRRVTSWHVTDGDTVRMHLEGENKLGAVGKPALRYGWVNELTITSRTDPFMTGVLGLHGPAIRLITLNTPERGTEGWSEATADLLDWFDYQPALEVELWPGDGAFSRYLGDVYVAGYRDRTASEYMLRQGWLPYLGARS